MTVAPRTVLAAGATRSIGRLVVAEALRQGNDVRVLVRSADKARGLSKGVLTVVSDVTRPDTLADAVDGVDAVVLTLVERPAE